MSNAHRDPREVSLATSARSKGSLGYAGLAKQRKTTKAVSVKASGGASPEWMAAPENVGKASKAFHGVRPSRNGRHAPEYRPRGGGGSAKKAARDAHVAWRDGLDEHERNVRRERGWTMRASPSAVSPSPSRREDKDKRLDPGAEKAIEDRLEQLQEDVQFFEGNLDAFYQALNYFMQRDASFGGQDAAANAGRRADPPPAESGAKVKRLMAKLEESRRECSDMASALEEANVTIATKQDALERAMGDVEDLATKESFLASKCEALALELDACSKVNKGAGEEDGAGKTEDANESERARDALRELESQLRDATAARDDLQRRLTERDAETAKETAKLLAMQEASETQESLHKSELEKARKQSSSLAKEFESLQAALAEMRSSQKAADASSQKESIVREGLARDLDRERARVTAMNAQVGEELAHIASLNAAVSGVLRDSVDASQLLSDIDDDLGIQIHGAVDELLAASRASLATGREGIAVASDVAAGVGDAGGSGGGGGEGGGASLFSDKGGIGAKPKVSWGTRSAIGEERGRMQDLLRSFVSSLTQVEPSLSPGFYPASYKESAVERGKDKEGDKEKGRKGDDYIGRMTHVFDQTIAWAKGLNSAKGDLEAANLAMEEKCTQYESKCQELERKLIKAREEAEEREREWGIGGGTGEGAALALPKGKALRKSMSSIDAMPLVPSPRARTRTFDNAAFQEHSSFGSSKVTFDDNVDIAFSSSSEDSDEDGGEGSGSGGEAIFSRQASTRSHANSEILDHIVADNEVLKLKVSQLELELKTCNNKLKEKEKEIGKQSAREMETIRRASVVYDTQNLSQKGFWNKGNRTKQSKTNEEMQALVADVTSRYSELSLKYAEACSECDEAKHKFRRTELELKALKEQYSIPDVLEDFSAWVSFRILVPGEGSEEFVTSALIVGTDGICIPWGLKGQHFFHYTCIAKFEVRDNEFAFLVLTNDSRKLQEMTIHCNVVVSHAILHSISQAIKQKLVSNLPPAEEFSTTPRTPHAGSVQR